MKHIILILITIVLLACKKSDTYAFRKTEEKLTGTWNIKEIDHRRLLSSNDITSASEEKVISINADHTLSYEDKMVNLFSGEWNLDSKVVYGYRYATVIYTLYMTIKDNNGNLYKLYKGEDLKVSAGKMTFSIKKKDGTDHFRFEK